VVCRESLEVPRLNYEAEEEEEEQEVDDAAVVGAGDPEYAECARAAGRSASWCRSVAVTVRGARCQQNRNHRSSD
jgi:hypothetical protein